MTEGLVGQRIRPDISPDAVVVVPGIMGSTLESESEVLWGGHRLGWYAESWTWRDSSPLDRLALTPDEQAVALAKAHGDVPLTQAELDGQFGLIRATSLLHKPAWAPFLRGLEPYGDLVAGITKKVIHADAVCEFAYDWRLPCAYNARRLEQRIREHLEAWLDHPEYQRFREELPDSRPSQVVVVAHSMGGLVARGLPDGLDVRATVTLGTPFDGAAMAPLVMNTGRGTPIPLPTARLRNRLRNMARTLPGLHDLLPTYRCLDDLEHDTDPQRLTPKIVEEIGGSLDLAAASFAWHKETAARVLPGHHPVIGINQPTDSSLSITAGVLSGHQYSFSVTAGRFARDQHGILDRRPRNGDGTVPKNSARAYQKVNHTQFSQQHGPLASVQESIDLVCAVLVDGETDERLGEGDIGLEVPDIATIGEEVTVAINGISGPTGASVTICDDTGREIDYPTVYYADGGYRASFEPPDIGIYQVVIDGGGTSAVSQRLLVMEP